MICASPGVLINAVTVKKKVHVGFYKLRQLKKKSQVLFKFYIFKKPQIKKKQDVIYTVYFFNKKEAKL